MKKALHIVLPGEGIGKVKFGDTTEQVRMNLGAPTQVEDLDQSIAFWDYAALKLRITFQSADWPAGTSMNKCVIHFTTRHPATNLWGKSIIALTESEILELFRSHGHNNHTVSSEAVGAVSYRTFQFGKLGIRLDFRDDLLRVVLLSKLTTGEPTGEMPLLASSRT